MAIADLLRGCPLFFELYDKELEQMVQHCSVFQFQEGEKIVSDGDRGEEIYVLLDGTAVISKGGQEIQTLRNGDVFGEMVLIDQPIRSADVIATQETFVLELRYDEIFRLFEKRPRIFGLVLLNVSRLITRRLRESNERILKLQPPGEPKKAA